MADHPCVISKQITVNGHVTGSEELIVEGRIEGKITLDNHLTVKPEAVVHADVEVADLNVDGELYGDVQSSKSIAIRSEGKLVGDIRAPRIIIDEGALYQGHIDMNVELPAGIKT